MFCYLVLISQRYEIKLFDMYAGEGGHALPLVRAEERVEESLCGDEGFINVSTN